MQVFDENLIEQWLDGEIDGKPMKKKQPSKPVKKIDKKAKSKDLLDDIIEDLDEFDIVNETDESIDTDTEQSVDEAEVITDEPVADETANDEIEEKAVETDVTDAELEADKTTEVTELEPELDETVDATELEPETDEVVDVTDAESDGTVEAVETETETEELTDEPEIESESDETADVESGEAETENDETPDEISESAPVEADEEQDTAEVAADVDDEDDLPNQSMNENAAEEEEVADDTQEHIDRLDKAAANRSKSSYGKEERRLIRKKIRRRNRIIAFAVLILVLAIAGAGAYCGVRLVLDYINNNRQVEEVTETETFVVEEEPPIIDMTPEIIEEPEEEVEEVVEEQSDEELLDEMVTTMIAQMTLEEKVAGLFIVSPEILTKQNGVTKAGDGTKAALETYPVGGIVYGKQNIKSSEQLQEMLGNTVAFNRFPMFIAISEAGGSESKLAALKVDSSLSAKDAGATGDSNAVFENYETISNYLRANGFNLNFGLSANTLTGGVKDGFGENPEEVGRMVGSAIHGMQENGVYTSVNYFPGMGYVSGDISSTTAKTERTKSEMESDELVPFKAAIEAGTDMIMVGHFMAPELTEDEIPCSMSKEVMTELLRNEMGYEGVIITDALNVSSISEYYAADEIAIKVLKAGADMVYMPEDLALAVDGVVNAVKEGTIDERRIDDSLARVYKIKYRSTLLN